MYACCPAELISTKQGIANLILRRVWQEKDNAVKWKWGETPRTGNELSHHELLWMIGGYEPEKGAPPRHMCPLLTLVACICRLAGCWASRLLP